ncbi:AAA family ATPase [Lysinibacillus xylanilyticus]|uniref:AAA family ATPase n=1 Tax=Lysinibacillus xylanilyticus TaxID=582475 RepID=UPI002B250DAB|nr:AAA family ATPase [Lysinibacillus xylanilyticus]MEB2299753.1 AAA family ATPase [Lysinibacillus xylanilyticus]
MDKVKWLQQMVEQNPADPQAHYWLGKELAENGRWLEAVQSYSTGISLCTDDTLRLEIIHELTKTSVHIQQTTSMEHSPVIEDEVHDNDEMIETEEAIAASAEELFNIEESEKQQKLLKNLKPRLTVIDGAGLKKTIQEVQKQVTFEDVAGLDDLKKTINLRIISPFYNKGLFAKFRKKVGGGVLLYGPPGCGKTFIAKATAGECKANFYPVHITDILSRYLGESEQNLKAAFDKARFQKPSIMFFDEVDTIGMSRSKASEYTRGIIDTFLTELEGIDTSTDEVLIMAATNTPWDIDSALKRPGRFDRLIFVAPPDEKAREQIFKLKLAGRYAENIDVTTLATQTEFFSGADIENVIELATENVLAEILSTGNERPITTNDLLHVLAEVQPSTLEWLRTAKNYVKYANQSGLYNDVEKYLRAHAKRI